MSIPRLDTRIFAGICELGPRPLVVTGWLKIWLQAHFAAKINIEDAPADGGDNALTRGLWKPDFKLTKIAIEPASKWTPELTEHRPAIILKREAWSRMRLGIDDRALFHFPPDWNNFYENFWKGSHTLFCITGDGAETEKLAAEVFRELNEFGPIVRRVLDLNRFEVMQVGPLLKMKIDARENFLVPITVSYVYSEAWKIIEEAPLFKKLLQRIDLAEFQP